MWTQKSITEKYKKFLLNQFNFLLEYHFGKNNIFKIFIYIWVHFGEFVINSPKWSQIYLNILKMLFSPKWSLIIYVFWLLWGEGVGPLEESCDWLRSQVATGVATWQCSQSQLSLKWPYTLSYPADQIFRLLHLPPNNTKVFFIHLSIHCQQSQKAMNHFHLYSLPNVSKVA